MGEIDEKPVDPVQTTIAVSFSDEITSDDNQQKFCPTWKDNQHEEVMRSKREREVLEKELANARFELEAKGSAYEQALLKLENQQKTTDDLTILLIRADIQKDYYINQCQEANACLLQLESSVDHMARHLSESRDTQEHLAQAMANLADTRAELDELRKAKLELALQLEEMRTALSEEKGKVNKFLRQVEDMKEAIVRLEMKGIEIEREKDEALFAKQVELELAARALSEAGEQLKTLRDLEAQMAEKSVYIDSLQVEIKEVNELHRTSQKAANEAIYEAIRLKEESEIQEKKNSDQAAYIVLLEAEMKEIRTELGNANIEAARLRGEVEDTNTRLNESREKENDVQVEIALLKFELHKGRSKLAAAEAAEVRAQAEKSALYNALQQMGLEAEETKKENRMLKEAMSVQHEESYQSNEETNGLQVVVVPENTTKEMEILMEKIGELRTRAEQAISRAEVAEKAKIALEEKVNRRKEHKERRKAALAALKEESISRDFGNGDGMIIKYEAAAAASPKRYQPLSKILNMKF